LCQYICMYVRRRCKTFAKMQRPEQGSCPLFSGH